jgi:hypothetical protein
MALSARFLLFIRHCCRFEVESSEDGFPDAWNLSTAVFTTVQGMSDGLWSFAYRPHY